MAETPALSVVVPIYNGAATIGELVNALRALEIPGGLEIVLVIDGSPDNSLAVCKQLATEPGAPIVLMNLSRNYGEHNAVMAGLSRSRGDFVVIMDDDLQNPPSEVPKLVAPLEADQWDVVFARYPAKKHPSPYSRRPKWRNFNAAI